MQPRNDFDLGALARQSNLHEQVLNDLYDRVGTDEKLGDSFKRAFEKNKEFDKVVSQVIVDNIKNNPDIKKSLQSTVEEIDRRWWNSAIAKLVFYMLGVISAVLIQILSKKLGD